MTSTRRLSKPARTSVVQTPAGRRGPLYRHQPATSDTQPLPLLQAKLRTASDGESPGQPSPAAQSSASTTPPVRHGSPHQPPTIQRLTIKPTGRDPQLNPDPRWKCGQYEKYWWFELDRCPPFEGYMVQKIEESSHLQACPNSPLAGQSQQEDRPVFWEAWRHNLGEVLDNEAHKKNSTDGSGRLVPAPNLIGEVHAKGEVKFFSIETTGDLGDVERDPSPAHGGWSAKAEPRSGGLPATLTEPTWWKNRPAEGPKYREAGVKWHCCGDANDGNWPFASP